MQNWEKVIQICVHYTYSAVSVTSSLVIFLRLCPFIITANQIFISSWTLLFTKVHKYVHKIPVKLYVRNNSRFGNSAFNMYHSFVYLAPFNEKSHSIYPLWMTIAQELFSNSERQLPLVQVFKMCGPFLVGWQTGELFINKAPFSEFFSDY